MPQTITTTYAGEAANAMLVSLVDGMDVLTKNLVYLHTGINYKMTIPVLDLTGDIVQAYAAEPSSVGTFATTERNFQMKDLTIYTSNINPNDWRSVWPQFAPSPSEAFNFLTMNATVRQAYFERLISKVSEVNAPNVWQGDDVTSPAATYNKYKGLLYRLKVDGSGQYTDVTPSGAAAFTSSNIDDALALVYDELVTRPSLHTSVDTVIICSHRTASLYQQYLVSISGKGSTSDNVAKIDELTFYGVRLVPSKGFPDNTLLCTYVNGGDPFASNLHLALRNANDDVSVTLGQKANGSHYWWLRMDYSIATAIGRYDDVIFYEV